MKQIYLVNKSKAVLGLFSGVKSRITLTQPLFKHYCVLTVALMLLLGGFSTRAWGATLTAQVGVGSGKGTAYVAIIDGYGVNQGSTSSTSRSLAEISFGMSTIRWAKSKYTASPDEGYTFSAWYTNEACTQGQQSGSGSSYTYETSTSKNKARTDKYYAKFTPKQYDVTLKANGGSGSDQTIRVTFDAAMPTALKTDGAIVKPTRDGYTFAGYYDAQTNGTKYYKADLTSAKNWDKDQTGTINLYAHWTANKYNVVFNGNGSNGGSMSKQEFTYGAASTALTANGFTRVYTVSYNANGGTTATTTTANTTATYTFDHWNTQANNGGTNYANQAPV